MFLVMKTRRRCGDNVVITLLSGSPSLPGQGLRACWTSLHLLLPAALWRRHCDRLRLTDEEAEAGRGSAQGLAMALGGAGPQTPMLPVRLTCWLPGLVASWLLPQGVGSVWALCSDSAFLCPSLIGREWIIKGKSWKMERIVNKWGEPAILKRTQPPGSRHAHSAPEGPVTISMSVVSRLCWNSKTSISVKACEPENIWQN